MPWKEPDWIRRPGDTTRTSRGWREADEPAQAEHPEAPEWRARPIHPLRKILIGFGILLLLALLFVVFFTKDGAVNLLLLFLAFLSLASQH